MRVFIYWNLHRKCWSIRDEATRRVVAHVQTAVVHSPEFIVSEAGNARVRREGRKNVHAGVRGYIDLANPEADAELLDCTAIPVRYNPYEMTTFQTITGDPIQRAQHCILHAGRAWAVNPGRVA